MDPISIGFALAEFAPTIAGWFGGDDAEDSAGKVVDAAKRLTGRDDPQDALEQIRANPELQIKFQQTMNTLHIARLEAETKQQAEVNATMRAELSSTDKFKSWWRPALGWSVVLSFFILMNGIVVILIYGVLTKPAIIQTFITAVSALMGTLTMIWTMAFAVLGVNVQARSGDKALAAGHPPKPGILESLTGILGKKK